MKGGEPELDAVVIGAGWAGIGVSHAMVRAGLRHRVLERARICETWRSQRWESFRMNTPNVLTVMPGDRYEGDDPEGFMTRDAFVTMVEEFALRHALPVETGTEVREVRAEGDGFAVQTPQGPLRARNVVVATGNLNTPAARPPPPTCPRPSPRSTPRPTALRRACRPARCSSSVAATPAARSPRTSPAPAAGSASPPAATAGSPAATAAATSSCG
jgi:hypothetical protein